MVCATLTDMGTGKEETVAIIDAMVAITARLSDLANTFGNSEPRDGTVKLLAECHYLRGDFADVISMCEQLLMVLTKEHRFVVEGVGEVEIKKTTRRTQWDHDRLIAAVVSRAIDEPGMLWDRESGEQLPPAAVGHNIASKLRECVSMGAGKLTGLRAIGLDADEFCVTEVGAKSVKLPTTRRPQ